MKLLTIFTPTYNRKKKLYDTYLSLNKQTCKDFIWLIVDDGSSDGTESIVKKWIKESDFEIIYKKKSNGGKHSAYNYALRFLKTKYVYLSLDSDDVMFDNDTIDKIIIELKSLNDEVGIITLCSSSRNGKNDFVKKYDISKLSNKSLAYAYSHNLFVAEGRMILLSDYVKQFKYPEIQNEKFFTEAYTYFQMDKVVKWTKLVTCYSQYLEDGLTANSTKLFTNNPNSWYMYNELRIRKTEILFLKLKYYIYFISFGLLSKNKLFKKGLNYSLIVLLFPISIIGIIILKCKVIKDD